MNAIFALDFETIDHNLVFNDENNFYDFRNCRFLKIFLRLFMNAIFALDFETKTIEHKFSMVKIIFTISFTKLYRDSIFKNFVAAQSISRVYS